VQAKLSSNPIFFNAGIENSQIGVNCENKSETELSLSSGSIARLSIPAFRVGDPGPNPGRSISKFKLVSVSFLSEKLNLGMSEGMVKIGARVYQ
jgi:hypothetical protein